MEWQSDLGHSDMNTEPQVFHPKGLKAHLPPALLPVARSARQARAPAAVRPRKRKWQRQAARRVQVERS